MNNLGISVSNRQSHTPASGPVILNLGGSVDTRRIFPRNSEPPATSSGTLLRELQERFTKIESLFESFHENYTQKIHVLDQGLTHLSGAVTNILNELDRMREEVDNIEVIEVVDDTVQVEEADGVQVEETDEVQVEETGVDQT